MKTVRNRALIKHENMIIKFIILFSVFLHLYAGTALAQESVYVKYRGPVNLAPFNCYNLKESSLVKNICYDDAERYLLVSLNGTFYHYCEVPASKVKEWIEADSLGRFYNSQIKGRFDCRINYMPLYE